MAVIARIKDVKRAAGGLRTASDAARKTLLEAAKAFRAAADDVDRLNRQYAVLRAEGDAAADRFSGVDAPTIPTLLAPNRDPVAIEALRIVQAIDLPDYPVIHEATEKCQHGLRTRRSYGEVAGTPTHEIIMAAGLKAFAVLNETQQRILAEREQEREQASRNAKQIGTLAKVEIARASVAGTGLR